MAIIPSFDTHNPSFSANNKIMKKNFLSTFFICGATGWVLECFWTGLSSIFNKHDPKLVCRTSLWMFPIYGLAAFIKPISRRLENSCVLVRGGVYSCIIFLTEFVTGELLNKIKACPWDYSKSRFNFDGVVRFDYLPVWFIVGLLYEKMLKKI